MKIYTVWANRTYSEEPELVTAWDEYSWDGNREGYEEEWRKGLASWGTDLDEYRHVVIEIPDQMLDTAFKTTVISAVVVNGHAEDACAGKQGVL